MKKKKSERERDKKEAGAVLINWRVIKTRTATQGVEGRRKKPGRSDTSKDTATLIRRRIFEIDRV